ncbi:MAG TPA: hypothetical protein PKU97_06145, partial [Kofleriaceae bacterium]|nr:hypothetical protein [Kofleriaceae bacterium]
MASSPSNDDVPKLPRGKGLSLSGAAIMRIGITAIALVALLVLQRPCSRAVGKFVTAFGGPSGGDPGAVAPGTAAPGPASAADPRPA